MSYLTGEAVFNDSEFQARFSDVKPLYNILGSGLCAVPGVFNHFETLYFSNFKVVHKGCFLIISHLRHIKFSSVKGGRDYDSNMCLHYVASQYDLFSFSCITASLYVTLPSTCRINIDVLVMQHRNGPLGNKWMGGFIELFFKRAGRLSW